MESNKEYFEAIRECLKVALELDEAEVQSVALDTTAAGLEKWTSATHQGLILELERRFGIEFDVLEIVDLVSIEAILLAVDGRAR